MNTEMNGDDLDIPEFLKRQADKAAIVQSEVHMSDESNVEAGDPAPVVASAKPRKVKAKANGASKPAKVAKAAPAKVKATSKPTKAKAKAKAKAPKASKVALDDFGFRVGSIKSQAAAMYASKKGATLAEVKAKLDSVQLNLLTTLEGEGYKVKKVKEEGPGARKITRYFLQAK